MTEARTQILARLPRATTPAAVVVPDVAVPDATLLDRFMGSIAANGLLGERTVGLGASRLTILANLRQAGASQVYASQSIDQVVPGLLDAMGMLGIETILLETDEARVDETVTQPKPVGAGLLVAAAAWADSGTLVIPFPLRRSALAYVWPPRVLVLLPAGRLFPSPRAWLAYLRQTGQLHAAFDTDFSLVSGRTLTHDVPSNAVAGVYAASEIHIFVIEPEESL